MYIMTDSENVVRSTVLPGSDVTIAENTGKITYCY